MMKNRTNRIAVATQTHAFAALRWLRVLFTEGTMPLGVDGDGLSAASKSTRHDRPAYDGFIAAVANMGFLDSCSSHLMLTNRKSN
ncbi:hypothetical protein Y032_0024g953 [Ancylostoma ceylanicum]|nr:hypothetical protein Y032_0024g953 [Ancylostoma ceylanicum]